LKEQLVGNFCVAEVLVMLNFEKNRPMADEKTDNIQKLRRYFG